MVGLAIYETDGFGLILKLKHPKDPKIYYVFPYNLLTYSCCILPAVRTNDFNK